MQKSPDKTHLKVYPQNQRYMSFYDTLISKLPGIEEPKSHLSFKTRLKWTAIILLLFLFMGQVTLYGIEPTEKERFFFFEMILGSSLGSLVTLGIGPIVTASIILQLLVGSKIIPWDLKTPQGKAKFQGTQKFLAIIFCIFEAFAFVSFGAIKPVSSDIMIFFMLIAQLAFGAFILLLMDEVVSKYGIGSGISLFIAAGVAKGIFVQAFNPLTPPNETVPAGRIPQFIAYLGLGQISTAFETLLPVIATIIIFMVVVYVQAMKVEIPLAFGSIRGFSRRWPLKLIYTSNIPVILVAALLANMQLIGSVVAKPVDESGNIVSDAAEAVKRCGFMGCFDNQGQPTDGIVYFLKTPTTLPIQVFFLIFLIIVFAVGFMAFYRQYKNPSKILLLSSVAGFVFSLIITNAFVGLPTAMDTARVVVYLLMFVIGSIVFSVFWVSTSGMDAHTVAEQIEGMGMQVPGFRRDPRIVEQVLNRYIPTLAIISGLFIGILAALADFTSALGTGTGILLTVMIVYSFYEQISMRYMEDMHPAFRKFFQ